MSNVFKKLKDSTPKSTGSEIGEALAGAMGEMQASNAQMNIMLGKTIAEALLKCNVNQPDNSKKDVKRWVFTVERNDKGLMTQVIATAT